ncbi:hypothetical protein BO83DRAFT_417950 [Aspergillus eucalypticola CBS 122712]|uniref:Uncharacterized protein n=1 Tax=Aspergillus eucalypticola (strain CBS 122712 / IBT 29274) TaxID=1448314 RepID=A0A317VEK6_ASPEC|nr:uncharacterized protein BO83DRAFT_417950 [Aspergillus eucalypticola CBS 122712]PWY71382.1 hypothetical protein BO83DRAFT_417950 [Aspergillus eucalypticola CBS 122712]
MLFSFKPTILLALALTAIATPIANPTVDEGNILVARAPRRDVDCNGKKFTKADIHNAIEQSKVVEDKRQTNAKAYGKYPEVYGNGEGLFGSSRTLYEYPLVSGTYSGKTNAGPPGNYRVIMDENYTYLGSVYHIPGNSFKKCTNLADTATTTATTTTTTKATTTATTKASSGNTSHKSGSKSGIIK